MPRDHRPSRRPFARSLARIACIAFLCQASVACAQLTLFAPPTPTAQLVATGISHDGSTVAGYWREPATTQTGSFVVREGELTYFDELPLAQRLSSDGTVLVGNAGSALWWVDARNPQPLVINPPIADGALLVGGLSADGRALSVIQFAPRTTLRGNAHILRLGQGFSPAFCPQFATLNFSNVVLASDGLTLAADGASEQGSVAFLRRPSGECVLLPSAISTGAGFSVRAISGDGSTVVGQSAGFATRWRNTTPQLIPIPAFGSSPTSQLTLTSADGSLVAGFGGVARDGSNEWLYSDEQGLQRLDLLVSSWTGSLPQGRLVLLALSGDARTLAGIAYAGDDATSPASLWIAKKPGCSDIDFDNDQLFPTDSDLVSFLTVLAGGPCPTDPPLGPGCDSLDFNADGITPSDEDLLDFLIVLAGGTCS
jgi:uncharacterized membrane protein